MKKYYIVITLLIALLYSCSDLMDAPKDDRVETEDIFRSKSKLLNYLDHPFWYIGTNGFDGGFIYDGNRSTLASFSDEALDSRNLEPGSSVNRWYTGKNTAESFNFNQELTSWEYYFSAVRRCNTIIQYLADPDYTIPASQFNEGFRNYYLAQVYIMRAFCYLELIKRYGGVPIITKRLEISYDLSNDKRASFAQCVDFIIADCKKGLEIGEKSQPALTWIFGAGISRRDFTAAIAWMIKSEAATFAASPLWSEDFEGTSKYTWERTLEIASKALEECLKNGYSLQNFAGNNTNETAQNITHYFLTAPDFTGASDKETIMVITSDGNIPRSKTWQYSGIPRTGQLSAGSCPTQELVDAFEITDGNIAHPILDLANPYNPTTHAPNINPKARALGYIDNGNAMYQNRDPRFYATIYYNGSSHGNTTVQTHIGGNHQISSDPNNIRNTRTGYYQKKYGNPISSVSDNQDGYSRYYRLAHLYLNYIEALNNVVGPTGSYNNTGLNQKTALGVLNELRATRGMPKIDESDVEDKAIFELRYRNERRVELAFEGKRFFDIRRWQLPSGDLSMTDKQLSGIEISSDETKYTRTLLTPRLCYDRKYLIFPLPYDEVKKVNTLTGEDWQNYGW